MTSRLALALSAAFAATALADARWPSFQNGGDVSLEADAGPWLAGVEVAWTAGVPGHGQASPVVWDGRVYATSMSILSLSVRHHFLPIYQR